MIQGDRQMLKFYQVVIYNLLLFNSSFLIGNLYRGFQIR